MNIEETAEEMRKLIERIKKGFQDDSFSDECSITQQAVVPILSGLAWPIFDTRIVKHQYRLGSLKPDIALFYKDELKVIIEVKKPGRPAEGGEAQLFGYAYAAGDSQQDTYNDGVSLVVLTTGKEWGFYLPWKPGGFQARQVYKVDIVLETEESVRRLMRYLSYPDVCSGKADEMAEADHGDKTRAKKIHDALPKAWDMLLSECDDSLISLLQDKVEGICNFRPDYDVVKAFSKKQSEKPHQPQKPPSPVVKERHEKRIEPKNKKLNGFELHGIKYNKGSGTDTLVAVFEALIKMDASFPDKFMAISHGRVRRWLENERHNLYPNHDEPYCKEHSRQLSTGHWIQIDNTTKETEQRIEAACKVADIQYGKDLKLLYL